MRYLVRCIRCDHAFWQAERVASLPEHNAWERHATAHLERTTRCKGGGGPGYWIAEGEGPIGGWPRDRDKDGGS